MAILSKKDLNGVFVLGAVVYLLDSVLGGFIMLGVVVAAVVVALVFYSDNPDSQKFIKNLGDSTNELVIRAALALGLIGVFLQNAMVIALGIFVGMVILFSQNNTLNVDVWGVKVSSSKSKTTQKKSK